MRFTDTYSFYACAGDGGDGVVRWRREKYRPKGGPSGGDGGRGGDVYVVAVRDIMQLSRIAHTDTYNGVRGGDGADNSRTGKDGERLTILLPVGSVVEKKATGEQFELTQEGDEIKILSGGTGGLGNEHFKSSTNQRPQQATKGTPGENSDFLVELKLIADAGLIGLPNAGKSTLLNTISNARARVGSYPFTTLSPNLGTYAGYVIADIPGLIEGAHNGKGLGHMFLRHVSRTRLLVHCISLDQDTVVESYNTVRTELSSYSEQLAALPEMIVITKSDTRTPDEVRAVVQMFEERTHQTVALVMSAYDLDSIGTFSNLLLERLSQLGSE